jgi:hypothetical protein
MSSSARPRHAACSVRSVPLADTCSLQALALLRETVDAVAADPAVKRGDSATLLSAARGLISEWTEGACPTASLLRGS